MRKYIVLAVISLFITMQACQKDERETQEKTTLEMPVDLSIGQARTWFEKQDLDLSGNTAAKQVAGIKNFTPKWNKATNGEDKDFYVVEVPLQFEKSPGFIIAGSSENRAGQTINGKTSLLILKHKPTNMLRSVLMHTILGDSPDINITYLNRGKNFSGDIFFTDTDGGFIKGWVYKNGKIVAGSKNDQQNKLGARAYLPETCETREIRTYERTCIFYDDYSIECSQWQYVGSTYQTYCSDEGNGGGGGGVGSTECDLPSASEVLSQGGPITETGSSRSGSPITSSTGETTKEWSGSWYFYRGTWLTYEWKYISFEKGVHKKVNNVWKWKSLTHVSHAQVGSSPFTTTCNIIMATPTISADGTVARMTLYYEVKMCIQCKGLNFGCASEIATSSNFWTIAPNGIVT